MSSPKLSDILDTLIFKDSKIHLKYFHALRTFETFKFLNQEIDFSVIQNTYDHIEAIYANQVSDLEGLRLVFSRTLPLSYRVEKYNIIKLNPIIQLQMITAPLANKQDLLYSAYKWEDRSCWDRRLKQKQSEADDILIVTAHNHIVEASRFNIFLYNEKQDQVFTPRLDSGCLNGVYRRFVLDQGYLDLPGIGNKKIIEENIKTEDLNHYRIFVGNSVRGLIPAHLITATA